MTVADDGSIDLTIEEAIKLHSVGLCLVCHDGKVVAIVGDKKKGDNRNEER